MIHLGVTLDVAVGDKLELLVDSIKVSFFVWNPAKIQANIVFTREV
jgi:hypothetical protein